MSKRWKGKSPFTVYGEEFENEDICYERESMPTGGMVGCCSLMVHIVNDTYSKGDSNEDFMNAEKAIREYVWAECQKAYKKGLGK